MKYLQWDPQYSVGDDDVDYEHQNLIETINEIFSELESDRDADEIYRTMSDVFAEISAHFALEERIMRLARYGEYEAHKNDHEDLLDEIRTMMESVQRDPDSAMDSLGDRLTDWFGKHFATFDARLHKKLVH